SASTSAASSAACAAASVTRFTLYGSRALAISAATAGWASAYPKRRPASDIALLKVRSTTSRGSSLRSGTAVGPPKSWYASSNTISAAVSASSRSTAPSGSGVPVGLFGELTTMRGARVSRAARTNPSRSNRKSPVSGTGTWRPPYTAASRRYRLNVGAGVTTAVPSPTVTASVAWISSLEPLPTSTPDATQAWRAASRSSSSVGVNGG